MKTGTMGWSVTVERDGERLLVLADDCISGKADLTVEEEATIREAAESLLLWAGPAQRSEFILDE